MKRSCNNPTPNGCGNRCSGSTESKQTRQDPITKSGICAGSLNRGGCVARGGRERRDSEQIEDLHLNTTRQSESESAAYSVETAGSDVGTNSSRHRRQFGGNWNIQVGWRCNEATGQCQAGIFGGVATSALCQQECSAVAPGAEWPKCGECLGGFYGQAGPGKTKCSPCPGTMTYSKPGWTQCQACTEIVGCGAGRSKCLTQDAPESSCSKCTNDRVLKNNARQCMKSCSFSGEECFPGSCSTGSDVGRQCECATGFEGHNCRRIKAANKPVILEHVLEFCDRAGAGASCIAANPDGNVYVGATTVAEYGNNKFIVAKFQHHWKPATGDAARFFSAPPYIPTRNPNPGNSVTKDGTVTYITDYKFGVVGAEARIDGYPQLKPAIQWNSKEGGAPTRDKPHTNVGDNLAVTNLNAIRLSDGLVLPHSLVITNGGYVAREKAKRYLTNSQTAVRVNTGAEPTRRVVFDFTPPVGSGDMLQRQTKEITTSSTVRVRAQNWADAASGMKSFLYVVCPMHDLGANLDWNPRDCVGQPRGREVGSAQCPGAATGTIACSPETFTLPAPGLYVVVLHAYDKAMNVRDARRFVLYDNNPTVNVHGIKHVKVTSAGNNGKPVSSGDELWQAKNGKFTMDWVGVFEDRENRQWYKPIRAHIPAIGKAYDEPDSSRISEVGTTAHTDAGITKYQWSLRSQTAATPSGFSTLQNPTSAPLAETLTLNNLNLPEGHLWTFTIEAWNIFGEAGASTTGKAIETVDFLVDTTAPDVEIEGLEANGMTGLELHAATDLRTMKFAFKAGDDQSALKSLKWTVTEDVITTGEACTVCTPESNSVALGGPCAIQDADCLCTPHGKCRTEAFKLPVHLHQQMSAGEHGRGYTFAITATNRAGLATTKSLRIVIDTTPPTVGTVFDGADPSFEVDFQMPRELKGSWMGFNDPESGIHGYRYLFSDAKVTELTSDFSEIVTDNFAGPVTMADEGKYYLCVVAINNAMSMSKVRCSDGVMTDQTPPEPPMIRVAGSARVSAGLAKDKDGKVWMIHADMTRQAVSNAPQACADKLTFVGTHPYVELPGSVKGEVVCSDGTPKFSPKFYQSSSTVVAINWECATPMEELREFEVGVAATSQGEPTLRPWKSVGLKTDSLILHGKLEKVVYVQVKAVKFTGAYTTSVIGPIFVDSTVPAGGSVSIAGFPAGLQITWSKFSDSESNLVYEVGAGTSADGADNVVGFRPAKDPANLCSGAANCGSVEGHVFGGAAGIHGVVRACNLAGLCRIVSSAKGTSVEMKPIAGRVFDLQSTAETTALTDIGYQTSTSRLYVVPSGFTGGNLKFQYAIGTTKGGVEVADFKNAGSMKDGEPFEIQASLSVGTMYYTTIKASNSLGFGTSTSNGVMPLGTGARPGGALVVHDGQGCASGAANLVSLGDRGSRQLVTSVPSLIQTTLHVGHKYTIRVVANVGATALVAGGLELTTSGVTTSIDAATGTAEFVALEVNATLSLMVPASKPSVLLDSLTVLDCSSDVSAQRQTDQLSVWWTAPDSPATKKAAHVQYYQHAVDVADADGGWTELRSFTRTANSDSSTIAMQLQAGAVYRSRVRACHPTGCYTPTSSNGVQISEVGPAAGNVMATYTQAVTHDGMTSLLINWQAFSDYGVEIEPVYQWAVASDSELANFVTAWSTVTPATADVDDVTVHYKKSDDWTYQVEATVSVDFSMFDAHDHLYVAVRGYGNSGITTVGLARAEATSLLAPELRVAVVDLETEMTPDDHRATDIQYTKQQDSLAAAWPSLWPDVNPDFYHWSISTTRSYVDCANTTSPMCGRAAGKTVAAKNLELAHGQRYYFCVKAGISTLNNGIDGGVQEGSDDTSCSNGITVDLTPATAGEVLLGYPSSHAFAEHHEFHPNTAVFQQSNSELVVRWHGFVDVEEFENAPHVSGIASYSLMIGSAVGVGDVWGPKNVGGATHEVVRGLSLKSGSTYYATVVATDYAGWTTTSTSRGVTVDQSVPGASVVVVSQATSADGATEVTASWTAAIDAESGVVEYLVGVGASAGSAELVPFQSAGRSVKLSLLLPATLPDGHPIVVTVKAVNGVGAVRNSASHPILVDSDGPTRGVVVMVDPTEAVQGGNPCAAGDISCTRLTFQATANAVALSWSGFDDVVGIQSFSWAVGTTPGGTDVHGYHQVPPSDNDAIQVAVADKLELADGSAYYASVRACDLENRCTVATSAAVIVDATPPVAGRVLDGYGEDDADFQADMNVIGASWEGFHDPHSHIDRYEWCAGLSRGKCDVVAVRSVGLLTSALATSLSKPVSSNDVVYVTVYAYNGAGLLTSGTSDGMHMDDKPGSISAAIEPVGRHESAGAIHAQSSRGVMEVSWKTSNFRAGPLAVWYSIASHAGSSPPVPVAKRVYGDGDTVTGLNLIDGDTYFITAVACDGADVCSVHKTEDEGLLVDGSAPHHNGWGATSTWKWTPKAVTLSWAVCTDPHSEVSEYSLSVGTEFGTSDVAYKTGIATEKGVTIATEAAFSGVTVDSIYYATLTCRNAAGMPSNPIHAQVKAIVGGQLRHYAHSCEVVGCGTDRQCSCGATSESCPGTLPACSAPPAKAPAITVKDGFDDAVDASVQYDTSALRAHWAWTGWKNNKQAQVRLQYAIFDKGTGQRAPPFKSLHRDWQDLPSRSTSVVYVAPEGETFTPGQTYEFHFRVWFSHTSYATHKSSGVLVAPAGPQLSRTTRLKESVGTDAPVGDHDGDHTSLLSKLSVSWAGTNGRSPVFYKSTNNQGAAIDKYEVAVGSLPGALDLSSGYRQLSSSEIAAQGASVKGLSLAHGQRYWVSVRATDATGIHKVASTDGIRVDRTEPIATSAVISDGRGIQDLDFQLPTTPLAATWSGFSDPESGIAFYRVGYVFIAGGGKLQPGQLPSKWRNVGLENAVAQITPSMPLETGTYYVFVKATNLVGKESDAVKSDGVVVDGTPAVAVSCGSSTGSNLASSTWAYAGDAATTAGEMVLPEPTSTATQKIATKVGTMYTVAFSARVDVDDDTYGGSKGVLSAGPDVFSFLAETVHVDPASHWREYTFQFVAGNKRSEVMFAASRHASYTPNLHIKDVVVTACTPSSDPSVHAGPAFQASFDTIAAQWNVDDEESGIAEFQWAIGTIVGGEQLQTYTSVGRNTHASTSQLVLAQGMKVYVTVLAKNGAGVSTTLSSSAAVTIDQTPPTIGDVSDGGPYQFVGNSISARWADAADEESGIAWCEYAVGKMPGAVDVVGFTRTKGRLSGISSEARVSLPSGKVADHDLLFVTTRCANGAGLVASATSEGVRVLLTAPAMDQATVEVNSPVSLSVHGSIPGVQSATDSIVVSWSGFGTVDGMPLGYEVQVRGKGAADKWFDVGTHQLATITDLQLVEKGKYVVAVRATDGAGRTSPEQLATVAVDTTPPSQTEIKPCAKKDGKHVKIDWAGVFSDATDLRYELSVGKSDSFGDQVMRVPVDAASFRFLPQSLKDTKYFVTLTAIDGAGHTTTFRTQVDVKAASSSSC